MNYPVYFQFEGPQVQFFKTRIPDPLGLKKKKTYSLLASLTEPIFEKNAMSRVELIGV